MNRRLSIKVLLLIILTAFIAPSTLSARVTPNDIYQATQQEFQNNLSKIQDPAQKQLVIQADQDLQSTNQTVCNRFDQDIAIMGAIMQELERRHHITSAVAGFGQLNSPIDRAEYYLNYAEEAVAYQKIQDYTPDIAGGNLKGGVTESLNELQSNLNTLQGKMLKAKQEVQLAVDYYEK